MATAVGALETARLAEALPAVAAQIENPYPLVRYLPRPALDVVDLYERRSTIEENSRDAKDIRFGLGLSATRISKPERRGRLLPIGALAQALLTLLGLRARRLGSIGR